MLEFRSLPGHEPYEKIRQLQLDWVKKRIEDQIPDTILFLEHTPVVTRGRGLQFTGTPRPRSIPLDLSRLDRIEFAESERGGDLTYHGPGQLVVYPICKLDGKGFAPKHDVVGFLRKIEEVFIQALEKKQIRARVCEDATGVWIGDQKVASMGIAVKRWVTYHGIAINCVNDLTPFHLISPCGFSPEVMTRLLDHLPKTAQNDWVKDENWRKDMESILISEFRKHSES